MKVFDIEPSPDYFVVVPFTYSTFLCEHFPRSVPFRNRCFYCCCCYSCFVVILWFVQCPAASAPIILFAGRCHCYVASFRGTEMRLNCALQEHFWDKDVVAIVSTTQRKPTQSPCQILFANCALSSVINYGNSFFGCLN